MMNSCTVRTIVTSAGYIREYAGFRLFTRNFVQRTKGPVWIRCSGQFSCTTQNGALRRLEEQERKRKD